MNVLPLVNKALTLYQWQQDIVGAERLLREALELDPECDSAVATLAQLTLQQGKLDEAVEMFSKHASIARTEPELEQALTFKYVCVFPSPIPSLAHGVLLLAFTVTLSIG